MLCDNVRNAYRSALNVSCLPPFWELKLTFCLCHSLILFILYFPRATPVHLSHVKAEVPTFRTALFVVAACVIHAVVAAIFSFTIVLAYPSQRQLGANLLGIMAAIFTSTQYFPQIYTTFKLKRAGSLSIPMMCMQTPGGFIWAASLAARLGPEGWSTWGLFTITATMQGIVLIMAVYYEYINPWKEPIDLEPDTQVEGYRTFGDGEVVNGDNTVSSEREPLLRASG